MAQLDGSKSKNESVQSITQSTSHKQQNVSNRAGEATNAANTSHKQQNVSNRAGEATNAANTSEKQQNESNRVDEATNVSSTKVSIEKI